MTLRANIISDHQESIPADKSTSGIDAGRSRRAVDRMDDLKRVYCGCSARGEIASFAFDAVTGRLQRREIAQLSPAPRPTKSTPLAVRPGGDFLYVADRGKPYGIVTFELDEDGVLTRISSASTAGSIAYLCADRSGSWLVGTSYPDSLIVIHPIDSASGIVGDATQVIGGVVKAHSVVLDASGRHCYVAALGEDRIRSFRFDSRDGQISAANPAHTDMTANSGPRHLAIHPTGRNLYCLNETDGTIDVLAIDGPSGELAPVHRVRASPVDAMRVGNVRAADLAITRCGRYLYASERTCSTIAGFSVDERNGRLTSLGSIPTERSPRGIRITPDGNFLLVAGELSENLAAYSIDASTGSLLEVDRQPAGAGANWIEIVERVARPGRFSEPAHST
jgi:6-phosphogluconolactonase